MSTDFVFQPASIPALSVEGSAALCPVHRIYCVGRNYTAHAREMGHSDREPPFFFSKPPDAVIQSELIAYPSRTRDLHHEVELVVVIGRQARNIQKEAALEHVFGYAVGVDLTRRDLQAAAKEKSRPWDVAKGFDESAPLSNIYPASQIGHPVKGKITLSVDGELRQSGNLADMTWSIPEVICELSHFFALLPGDLVFTGTPNGVAAIDPGSVIECSIEGIGSLSFTMSGRPKE